MYVGVGRVLPKLSLGKPPQHYYQPQQTLQPPPQPQQVSAPRQSVPYQYGYGRIYSNGIAEFTVYSPYKAQIIKASISGTSYTTTDIAPNQLNVGYNNIKATFIANQGLILNTSYTIQLYLSDGQIVDIQALYS
nr:DUF973 family protein [Stygiolobus caldivivus]